MRDRADTRECLNQMAFVSSPAIRLIQQRKAFVCSRSSPTPLTSFASRRAMVTSCVVIEKGAGMRIIKCADEDTVAKLGCRSWPTWGCGPSTFPWTYSDDEVCLVLTGDFTVFPDDGSESMDVKAGDIAYFPKNMSCTWEVREVVQKHFTFGTKL